MAITDRDIQYVAELARLSLSEEEADRLAKDMESIIGYSMNKLKELDTDAVKPMEHVLSKRNVFRLDECENPLTGMNCCKTLLIRKMVALGYRRLSTGIERRDFIGFNTVNHHGNS